MKKCNSCKVSVNTNMSYCPLCGDQLVQGEDFVAINFPTPKKYIDKSKKVFISRLFSILAVMTVLASIIVNVITYNDAPYLWSVLSLIAVLYVWSLVTKSILKKDNVAKILFKQFFYISLMLLAIDFLLTDSSHWSINYAIPALSLLICISTTAVVFANLLFYRDHLHYALIILLMGFLQLILLFFSTWNLLIYISSGYSFLAFIVLLIIADKKVVNELKKRLHF